MNRIGPDRIGRGFKPNWIEPVFLGEFEGAEPPHALRGVCGGGGGGGGGGGSPPRLLELAIASERARDSERASEAEGRLKRGVRGGFSPPGVAGGLGGGSPPADASAIWETGGPRGAQRAHLGGPTGCPRGPRGGPTGCPRGPRGGPMGCPRGPRGGNRIFPARRFTR